MAKWWQMDADDGNEQQVFQMEKWQMMVVMGFT